MKPESAATPDILSPEDQNELTKLINVLELSEGAATIFAIAPDCSAKHPVVEHLKLLLADIDESFQLQNFFYSERDFYTFLHSLDRSDTPHPKADRRLVMAFGLDQLDLPRLKREMKQLNLGREVIFEHNLVLIFWLNRIDFLDEFRRRAPDFWDWRGKVAIFKTHPPIDPLLYPYLERLISENSYLKVSGVMQVQRQVDLFLDQIYVSLQAEQRQQITRSATSFQEQILETSFRENLSDDFDEFEADKNFSSTTVTERLDLAEVVKRHQYSVILGDPGAGKTTLLRYLALHFAKALRENGPDDVQGGENEILGKRLLPIFFRIAEYSEKLVQQPNLSLLQFLERFYRQPQLDTQTNGSTVNGLLCNKLQNGQCLILMDGLDEVFDQTSRQLIVQRIEDFVAAHNTNKFVITSRIAGYQDADLSNRFAHFTITTMDSEQVEQFLRRWCLAIEQAQQPDNTPEFIQHKAEEETQDILSAIAANEGVKRLTTNPLLLTILALIHRNGAQLPQRRVELYSLAVKTLTEDWQLGKKLPNAPKVLLKENEVVELLAPLAYWMHEKKPSGLVTQIEVEQQLSATLAKLNALEPDSDSVKQTVTKFLRKVRETTGLFVERAPDVYGFMHLTFEEYFAARYIADNHPKQILRLIRKHLGKPRWQEPILLALGYYSSHSPGQVNELVKNLFSGWLKFPIRPTLKFYCQISRLSKLGERLSFLKLLYLSLAVPFISLGKPIIFANRLSKSIYKWFSKKLKGWQKRLIFVGQVLAEVEVNSYLRNQFVERVILISLLLYSEATYEEIKELFKMVREIEIFNQKREVLYVLEKISNSLLLTDKMREAVELAILYIACSESGMHLVKCGVNLVNLLTPRLFVGIQKLIEELGEEMSSALEETLSQCSCSDSDKQAIIFLTALSYIRKTHHSKAVELLEEILACPSEKLEPFIIWALAICPQATTKKFQTIDQYRLAAEQLASCHSQKDLISFWENLGLKFDVNDCRNQALECFFQAAAIAKQLNYFIKQAYIINSIGKTYQQLEKYEKAIENHQKSRRIYQKIGWLNNASNQLDEIATCYEKWGKYQDAIEFGIKRLRVCKRLRNQQGMAYSYWRLGNIYQAWVKYEEAVSHYHQSRDLYEQLDQEQNVAILWNWLGGCYCDWGKYKQAIEHQQQCLVSRQKLDAQADIALSYSQFGRIYRDWCKYEEALSHYQQSRALYDRLDREKSVANLWHNLADCYRDWGKYEQAVECELKGLEIQQKLDDKANIADLECQLGRIYQAWRKYEEAIAHYQQSCNLYGKLGLGKDVANQWYWLGDCYRAWGKYEQAVEHQQQCFAIREKLDNQADVALSYYQLGRIFQDWGKYEEVIAHYQQSRDLYKQLNLDKDVAILWYWLGDCYKRWGKYEQAVEYQHQCLALRQKLDNQADVALSYCELGRIYQTWGKYEEAIAHYQQSRNLYKKLDLEKNVANQWGWLTDTYRDWGKYEQALDSAQQCLELCQHLEIQPAVAQAYYRFGCIYQAWGKYEEAILPHQQSRDLYEQIGKEKDVAIQWYNLADCYRDWGKYDQAIECELKDLEIRQELDDQLGIAGGEYQLGRIYQAWGKYEEAITHHQQSLDLYDQLSREQNVASQCYWLSDCYRAWNKYEQALKYQQQCLAIWEKLDNQAGIASASWQLGSIYQAWGKYEEVITYYQQSHDLYDQLDLERSIAILLCSIADCYRDWGKYEQAIECELKDLEIRQKLDDQLGIAGGEYQLGCIYQAWGKCEEAIAHHQKSLEIYEDLDRQQNIANQLSWLASCYRDLEDYTKAIDYYRQSRDLYQQLDQNESRARRCRYIGNSQRLLAKNTADKSTALTRFTQAEQHIDQAIQINTENDYRENLAYDHTVLGLLYGDRLRLWPFDGPPLQHHISQFHHHFNTGFEYFDQLGQTVDHADKALDMARVYLEVEVLEDLDHAETITQDALQTFRNFNRRKLQAAALKLLGEIYRQRAQRQQANTESTARQYLAESLQLYRDLDLAKKVAEVGELLE